MSPNVRNASEHALVDTEHKIRNARAADRRIPKDATKTEVVESSDEFAGLVRKCERIAPEEPLEGYDSRSHDG